MTIDSYFSLDDDPMHAISYSCNPYLLSKTMVKPVHKHISFLPLYVWIAWALYYASFCLDSQPRPPEANCKKDDNYFLKV